MILKCINCGKNVNVLMRLDVEMYPRCRSCRILKILIISSAAIPAPIIDSYGGLEALAGWLTMEFAKNGHDVTLVTTKGSEWAGTHPIM